jgi:GNAT superfamily N-acetyltransferase
MEGTVEPPLPGLVVRRAGPHDAAEILVLQRCCWVDDALANGTLAIPALHETLDDVRGWIGRMHVWVVRRDGRLVGAVRALAEGDRWEIGRLMVAPDLAGRGLGRWLLELAEAQAPPSAARFGLFVGRRSARNLRMYARAGYRPADPPTGTPAEHVEVAVFLTKPRPTG